MLRQRGIFIILFLLHFTIASATKYYISSSNGDDDPSRDGKSEATSWKTISKVNGMTFLPGDSILFKRGDVWRETLKIPSSGTLGNYIVFTSYGKTGAKPQILGSKQAITWTETATSNVWQSATFLTNPIVALSGNVCFVKKDGSVSPGMKKTSLASLTAGYNWYWESNVLYIYAESDPDERYNAIEVTQRMDCIHLNSKDYVEINGIDLFYSQVDGIVETYPTEGHSGLIIRNCEIAYIGYIGHIGEPDYLGYGVEAVYNNSLFEYDTIHHCGRRGLSLNHYGTADISDITVQYCVFYHGYHTTGCDVATGSTSGDNGDMYNLIIRNNLFYEDENRVTAGTAFIQLVSGVAGSGVIDNISIYNNLFKFTDGSAITSYFDTDHLYVYNNTFYGFTKTRTDELTFIKFDNVYNGNKSFVKNNIFYNNAVYATANYAISIFLFEDMNDAYSDKDDIVADHNLYFNTDAETKLILSWNDPHNWYTMSQWSTMKSAMGWEPNSPDPADPMFVKAPDILNLDSISPAIQKGITIGTIKTDYTNKVYKEPPSIGAFEFWPNEVPPFEMTNTKESVVIIYPNPSHGFVTIIREGEALYSQSFRMVSMSGKIVLNGFLESGVKSKQFPVNLKAGIYIVQVLSSNFTTNAQKLIVVL